MFPVVKVLSGWTRYAFTAPAETRQVASLPVIYSELKIKDAMNLTINGEQQSSSAQSLGALVEELGMKPDRVAIELNREIVSRDRWAQTPLRDGDRLEIVHFVGGGSDLPGPTAGLATDLATC
jgi:sulfur carrier protein